MFKKTLVLLGVAAAAALLMMLLAQLVPGPQQVASVRLGFLIGALTGAALAYFGTR